MRGGVLVALSGVLCAQAPPDPTEVLTQARDRIVQSQPRLPNYTCVQTVDRSYFRKDKQPHPLSSCGQMRSEKNAHNGHPALVLTDRLRLDVKISAGEEIGSWAGASQFDVKSIFDLVATGPFATGALGGFVFDILASGGVQFVNESTSNGTTLYRYRFQVPLASSHHLVKVGQSWQAVAYEGEIGIDPHTFDLRHVLLRSSELPPETETCEMTNTVEYAMVRLSSGDFLLPQQSRFHVVMANTQESDVTTTYTGCREYQSESTIHFEEGAPAETVGENAGTAVPVKLPRGLPIALELEKPIDTDLAAAGDVVIEKVCKTVRAKGSKEVLIPAGATVLGRIVKMQHWLSPPARFDIAILLEKWDAGGVWTPLLAEPDRRSVGADLSVRRRGLPAALPPTSPPTRVNTFLFPTNQNRFVVPRGFESKWITTDVPSLQ